VKVLLDGTVARSILMGALDKLALAKFVGLERRGNEMALLAPAFVRRFKFDRTLKGLMRRLLETEGSALPQSIGLPPGSRLLVLAPHPDDESIGCGGTLAKWRDAGWPAKVLFLTDGRLGSRDLRAMDPSDPKRGHAQQALIETRQREAKCALRILGVQEHTFAAIPDGELWRHTDQATEIIARAIDDDQPDLLMLPFLTDRHPDHAATGASLLGALRGLGSRRRQKLICAGYEVWSPIQANSVIDITAWVERKKSAIGVYKSQLRDTNYLDGALSLNRFRAVSSLMTGSHAEAFYVASADVYLAMAG
jgi:LmbE family N-acetylglucosaminyl deacetylase